MISGPGKPATPTDSGAVGERTGGSKAQGKQSPDEAQETNNSNRDYLDPAAVNGKNLTATTYRSSFNEILCKGLSFAYHATNFGVRLLGSLGCVAHPNPLNQQSIGNLARDGEAWQQSINTNQDKRKVKLNSTPTIAPTVPKKT